MIGVITPLETCSEAKEVLDDDDEDVGEVVRQAQVGYSVSVVPAQIVFVLFRYNGYIFCTYFIEVCNMFEN